MLIEAVRGALETGRVCDGCLGRCFADRSSGLSNDARGEILRGYVAIEMDEPFEPIDPEDCWVCEGLSPDFDLWADRIVEAVQDLSFETFLVGTHVPDQMEDHEAELREQAGLETDVGEPLNAEINREVGKRLEDRLDAVVDFDYPDVVTIMNLDTEEVALQLNPAYLSGRYTKHTAGLPQRVRICRVCNGTGTQTQEGATTPCEACEESGYDTKESVEWYITEAIKEAMDGTETVFNAAGHEDEHVLVRGDGRPFVVEVKQPHIRPPDTEQLQETIATTSENAITVEGLTEASRELVEYLSEAAIHETYRLEISFSETIQQEAFAEAVEELDSASVRQSVERDDRTVDQYRTLGRVSGELTGKSAATIDIEAIEGVDFEALMIGGADRSDPNVKDLLNTSVTVESIAVVAIEGADEPLDLSPYLSD